MRHYRVRVGQAWVAAHGVTGLRSVVRGWVARNGEAWWDDPDSGRVVWRQRTVAWVDRSGRVWEIDRGQELPEERDEAFEQKLKKGWDEYQAGGGRTKSAHRAVGGLVLSLVRVRLNRDGYDARGRYFGVGAPLWQYSGDDGSRGSYVQGEVRAADREGAKRKVRAIVKGARFAR